MLLEILLLVSATTSVAPTKSAAPSIAEAPATTSAANPAQDRGAALVESLAKVCANHPEVERAFVLSQVSPDGSVSYMFVPIFDRKVSDLVLSEADKAYRALFPAGGYLQVTLLARNTWKKQLAGVPPIYVRPKPTGKS